MKVVNVLLYFTLALTINDLDWKRYVAVMTMVVLIDIISAETARR